MFEPDNLLYEISKERAKIHNLRNVQVYKKGMYSESKVLHFDENADIGSSAIKESGANTIETISLDELKI